MGNGIQITGLSSSFDLSASNFATDVPALFSLGNSVSKAASTLPATTSANLFTIAGGRILLTAIVGQVTTIVQAQACNLSLAFDPTVAGTNVALCGVLNITGNVVGSLYSITGVASDALMNGLAVTSMSTQVILQPGAIVWTTSATNTGQASWKMWYLPLDTGVTVVAA